MKKYFRILAVAICATMMFSGCGSKQKDDNIEDKMYEISEYGDIHDKQVAEVLNTEWKHIRFNEEAYFEELPKFDSVCVYETSNDSSDGSVEDGIDRIKNIASLYGYPESKIEDNLYDANSRVNEVEIEPGYVEFDHALVYEHLDDGIVKNGDFFYIDTDELHIQMGNGGVYSLSDGEISRYAGSTDAIAMDALDNNSDDYTYVGRVADVADEKFDTLGGEITIGEAAEIVKSFLNNNSILPKDLTTKAEPYQAYVKKVNDKYCIMFTVIGRVDNVPISSGNIRTINGWNTSGYTAAPTRATSIVFNGKVDAAVYAGLLDKFEVKDKQYTSILGLKAATELLDDFLGQNIVLKVEQIKFVYERLIYEGGTNEIKPAWEFTGYNSTSEREMMIWVNAIDGTVEYIMS